MGNGNWLAIVGLPLKRDFHFGKIWMGWCSCVEERVVWFIVEKTRGTFAGTYRTVPYLTLPYIACITHVTLTF